MLRHLNVNDLEEAINLAYGLSKNPVTNSYPLRESKNEFVKGLRRGIEHPEYLLIGYYSNQLLIGVMCLNVLENDHYLSSSGLYIRENRHDVMMSFIDYLKENYAGYEMHIGFPKENVNAITLLMEHGFSLADSCIDQRLNKTDYVPSKMKHRVVRVDQSNYKEFAHYHDCNAPEMYWNSSRIKENLNNWVIYSYYTNKVVKGTIAARKIKNNIEIFALLVDEKYVNKGIESDLITEALNEGFEDPRMEEAVYFIDSDDKEAANYSKVLGFSVYSNYILLHTKL